MTEETPTIEVKSAAQLIEDGVALVVHGMFQIGSPEPYGNDPMGAFESGMAAVSTIRDLAMDFARKDGQA